MSLVIVNETVNYNTFVGFDGDSYIVSYFTSYNISLDTYLRNLYKYIVPFYSTGNVHYSNTCGGNVEYICQRLSSKNISSGKLIITDWVEKNTVFLTQITSVYGSKFTVNIGLSYHALTYLVKTINNQRR